MALWVYDENLLICVESAIKIISYIQSDYIHMSIYIYTLPKYETLDKLAPLALGM